MDGVAGVEMKDAAAVDTTGVPVSEQSYARLADPIILSDEDAASVFTVAIAAMFGVGACVGWAMHAVYLAVTA
jgi:hypothetical protein